MYFFTRRRRASNNSSKRFSRSVDEEGLWDGHAAGMSLYKIEQARNNKEKIKIGHRAQLAFKLFDDPNDKKNKKSTMWILHEYRLVDDNADDVVLCRIHKRKDKDKDEEEVEEERMAPVINTQQRVDEQVSLLPAVQPLMEVNAVATADVDDDDISFVQLLEEELTEVEVEQRRVKRQRMRRRRRRRRKSLYFNESATVAISDGEKMCQEAEDRTRRRRRSSSGLCC